MNYDGAVWGSLACALSALGAVLSYLAWQRRGAYAGLRGAAWSLLPIAAWLTGTLRLTTEVIGDVGDWAVRLVLSPAVWLGICLAGVSVLLFGVSGALRKRRDRTGGSKVVTGSKARKSKAVSSRSSRNKGGPGGKGGDPGGLDDMDDMDDIAAILKKHGIS